MYAIEISENGSSSEFYLCCIDEDSYYEVELDGEEAEVVGETDEDSFEGKVDEGVEIIKFGDLDINVVQAVESHHHF